MTARPDDLASLCSHVRVVPSAGRATPVAGVRQPVRLGSRALDILIAFIERRGETVTNEELIARVWPKTYVEDGNLRVHIASLRGVLGERQEQPTHIANIPGRGYQFVAPVSLEHAEAPPRRWWQHRRTSRPSLARAGPRRAHCVAGDRFVALAPHYRWSGPAESCKTSGRRGAGGRADSTYRDGVRFIDLTPITDPALLPGTFASEFGIAARADDPIPPLSRI